MIVQECVNNNCNNTIYVEKHKIGLPLQCQKCIDKKSNKI